MLNKKINSRSKGKRGERETCKILNDVLFNGEKKFAPTPQSGAWGGGKNREYREDMSQKQKETLVSDIMTPDGFKFIIENKYYAEADFWDLFNENSKMNEWTEQVSNDAEFVGKEPMLIIKYNYHKRIVLMRDYLNADLDLVFVWTDAKKRIWGCLFLEDFLKKYYWFFDE